MDLNNNKIHIWTCQLDQSDQVLSGLYSTLSGEERIRAEKLRFSEIRNRWIVSRGVLRLLLSRYSGYAPKTIDFKFNDYGKPLLSEVFKEIEISFNLSHANNLAVYIFTKNRRVGIDLEKIEELNDIEGITGVVFNEYERNWFNKVSQEDRKKYFYRLWTCKEAYIKAIGKGFSFSPEKITLDLNPDQELYFKKIIEDDNFKNWNIVEIMTQPGFISSAVVEGDDFTIEQFHLNLFTGREKNLHSSEADISYSIEKINSKGVL